ncbi:ABC-type cobalamin/Fe3+-siderophores transport system ATPase subunit [Marinobacterium sp. MBR-111]|jgi:ABC-type cobalamin/Fe3+-siderophores transport system ATPase subunit|uniref:ATP-binding protein n=1 Tax=Marinobacterium sp. MBR-111 TaxID=3156463 RepID=UPI0033955549
MKIKTIYTYQVGPLADGEITFDNDWTEEVESKVLLTGPNGCGKSTVIRGCAMLWTALAYWLDQRKALPQKHEAKQWLQRWGGMAILLDEMTDVTAQPSVQVGLMFGSISWCEEIKAKTPEVFWIGEAIERTGKPGQPKRALYLPKETWVDDWSQKRKKLILSSEKLAAPNIMYLDAEERRWVTPKRNIAEPLPDVLTQRWLTKYLVTDDWKGQLEASLINLKTTQLHKFHEVIRGLNQFLVGKEIDSDIKPGEGRLRVKIKGERGVYHSIDELSAGEHQVLILIFLMLRWLQPGGVVLIDEPDLYLHPSLVDPLLDVLERTAQELEAQLIITSHSVSIWRRYETSGTRVELKTGRS